MIFRTPGDLSAHFLGVVNEDELWWCVGLFFFFSLCGMWSFFKAPAGSFQL